MVGVRKSFGRTTALDGLDLTVRAGEVHAFLGPNGAGKTTTIRILLGLLKADAGQAVLLGGDPWRDAVELHRPFTQVPKLGATVAPGPLARLCGIAVAFGAVGLYGLRRRDLGDLGPTYRGGRVHDWLVDYLQISQKASRTSS